MRPPARVVILGGSFAGLFTALELEKRMPAWLRWRAAYLLTPPGLGVGTEEVRR